MSKKIDDLTGLPKLPEGQWWEVAEVKQPEGGYAWLTVDDLANFQVRIKTKFMKQQEPKRVEGEWPWSKVRFVAQPAIEKTRTLYCEGVWVDDVTGAKPESTLVTDMRSGRECLSPVRPQPAGNLTPDAIRRAAERLVKRIAAQKAEAARRAAEKSATEALLGAYPPKSLAVAK